MTLGADQDPSPYYIPDFHAGIESVGAVAEMKTIYETYVDVENRIVSVCSLLYDGPDDRYRIFELTQNGD
ncbi:hypothetical protein JYT25_00135 [bacterium AH-315-C20]|nr:hypothetical protein [bacterium AH-315-C20]